MDLTEGGIRVPYVARWPGRIPAGSLSDELVITMDWSRTFLAAAGVAESPDHPMDVRRPDAAAGSADAQRLDRALFWRMKYRDQHAMREGRWKYLRIEGIEYLFDLSDERERANRGADEPQRLADMRAGYARWYDSLPPIPADADYDLVVTERDMPGAHLR